MNVMGEMHRRAGLFVVMLAILVYVNSLGNGFVWDDHNVILTNPALEQSALSLFGGIDTTGEFELTPYYRPLTLLVFLLEKRLHGHAALPMHALSVLIHAANAFLFFRLARSLMPHQTRAAMLAGLLFAVHPINTESVNFLSGRNTMLCGGFILLAYACHERGARQNALSWAVAGGLLYLAGLFFKETALALLLLIVALGASGSFHGKDNAIRRGHLYRLVPYAISTAVYLALRSRALSGAGVQIEWVQGLGTA